MEPTSTMRDLLRTLGLAAALLVLPLPAAAQTVRGVVLDAASGAPVAAAFVLLVPAAAGDMPADSAVDGAVTDSLGRFLLTPPAPGRYRLRVDRIGYQSHLAEAFETVPSEPVDRQIRALFQPIDLLSLDLPGGRCVVDPRGSDVMGRVWEEARKALAAAVWAERRAAFRFTIRTYERTLDPRRAEVREETSRERSGVRSSSPYISLPAEDLAENGYARIEDGGLRYYAPDAQALVSDHFLKNHCFDLTWGDRIGQPGWIGLEFKPARGGPDVADVKGVIWIDVTSAELRRVDLEYVDLPDPMSDYSAEAQVEFGRAPTGAWIIPRWWIRTPVLGFVEERGGGAGAPRMVTSGRGQVGLVARLETGGVVLRTEGVAP
jgi:hypothetical protein